MGVRIDESYLSCDGTLLNTIYCYGYIRLTITTKSATRDPLFTRGTCGLLSESEDQLPFLLTLFLSSYSFTPLDTSLTSERICVPSLLVGTLQRE